jgi:Fe-S-cluster containining protein
MSDALRFDCARCGTCCRASIPLGLEEALDYDGEFLLALVLSMETWNLGDFKKNRPAVPIGHDDLLTALAFRKDKLALDQSRDVAFQVGRVRASGERVATTITASACGLGDFEGGGARCPALSPENACAIYERRPLGCRVFPLDPMFPEMLQRVPLAHRKSRLPCDFSDAAPAVFAEGRLMDPEAAKLLAERQETIRRDSLFLPYYGMAAANYHPMPSLSEALLAMKGNGKIDLPFVPVLVFLTAAGRISPERAELSLMRQHALAAKAVTQAVARKDKAERARTAVLRNCLALMESFKGRMEQAANGLAAPAG